MQTLFLSKQKSVEEKKGKEKGSEKEESQEKGGNEGDKGKEKEESEEERITRVSKEMKMDQVRGAERGKQAYLSSFPVPFLSERFNQNFSTATIQNDGKEAMYALFSLFLCLSSFFF